MAYKILKDSGQPALVSDLVLDAHRKQVVNSKNCGIDHLLFSPAGISFTLLENALPFPVSEIPSAAQSLVPFVAEFNRQLFKVTGLEDGDYELSIDDIAIGTWSFDELSRGINLAVIAGTPQNIQAAEVAELNNKRHAIEGKRLRYLAMMEYGQIKKQIAIDDVETAKKWVDGVMEMVGDNLQIRWEAHEEKAEALIGIAVVELSSADADGFVSVSGRLPVPDRAKSFRVSFISGWGPESTGTVWLDDVTIGY